MSSAKSALEEKQVRDKLDKLTTTLTDGTNKVLMVGSNDINGGTPHRHATIDGNGRLLVVPYEHPNSVRTNHLEAIANHHTTKTHQTQTLNLVAGTYTYSQTFETLKQQVAVSLKSINYSTNSGDIKIQASHDGTTWFLIDSIMISQYANMSVIPTEYDWNRSFRWQPRYLRLECFNSGGVAFDLQIVVHN